MDVMEAIKTRRSIRSYKPDQIPENMLTEILEAARWAPSWANSQCWEFVVIQDFEVKKHLATHLSPNNPATTAITEAPLVIAACGHRGKSGYYKGEPRTDKGDWYMFDLGIATQNLALAAHSLGLGTVHVGFFNHKEVAKILEIPDDMEVVELLPLGFPASEPKPTPRKELKEIVSHNKYEKKS